MCYCARAKVNLRRLQENYALVVSQRSKARAIPNYFNLNQFARLVGFLTGNRTARSTMIHSGDDLTRVVRQRKGNQDLFWKTVVAPIFDYHSYEVHRKVSGCFATDIESERVQPNLPPLFSGVVCF